MTETCEHTHKYLILTTILNSFTFVTQTIEQIAKLILHWTPYNNSTPKLLDSDYGGMPDPM